MPFVVAVGALIKGASYTLLIHDNYPEILIATKKSKPGSLVVNTLSFFNRWLYKHASKIIVVGRDMRELLARKTEGLDIPIVCIPNWAELDSVEPASKADNRMLGELGLRDKVVFLYAGNMGHPNDLESIVAAAQALHDRGDLHFIFLGAGVKRKWLQERVSTLALKNVSILDPRPRAEQNDFLNACDIAIVSLVENMVGVSMPSRTYNILAAGKPILAVTEEGSELAQVVVEEDVGWMVKPGSAEDLTKAILEILDRPAELGAMGERARSAAINRYSLEAALGKYRGEL
jgi:glycosyltransferase involved in cell wall biosynthesis